MQRTLPTIRAITVIGCLLPGVSEAAKQKQLAILPIEAVNLDSRNATTTEQHLWRAISARKRHAIIAKPKPALALAEQPEGCPRDVSCLRRVGKQVHADIVLTLRVGRLGNTTVVQLTAYDVARGARAGSWEEILRDGSIAKIKRAIDRMVESFAPPEVIKASPWYRKWWVWTTAAAVVAGSVALTIALTAKSDPMPDRVIRPPPYP